MSAPRLTARMTKCENVIFIRTGIWFWGGMECGLVYRRMEREQKRRKCEGD